MAEQRLLFSYSLDESVLTVDEIKRSYLFGIDIKDASGNLLPDSAYQFYINAAIEEIEGFLDIRTRKTVIKEDRKWDLHQFRSLGYIPTSFPVEEPFEVVGSINDITNITYPKKWLTVHSSTKNTPWRKIHLLPASENVTVGNASGGAFLFPTLDGSMNGFFAQQNMIPHYWKLVYVTPGIQGADLINAIGKMASMSLLNVAGDVVGGEPGLSNYSISIDGLSQSKGFTASATSALYTARVLQYEKELKEMLPKLKSRYGALGFKML